MRSGCQRATCAYSPDSRSSGSGSGRAGWAGVVASVPMMAAASSGSAAKAALALRASTRGPSCATAQPLAGAGSNSGSGMIALGFQPARAASASQPAICSRATTATGRRPLPGATVIWGSASARRSASAIRAAAAAWAGARSGRSSQCSATASPGTASTSGDPSGAGQPAPPVPSLRCQRTRGTSVTSTDFGIMPRLPSGAAAVSPGGCRHRSSRFGPA